jgi:transcriptional regulator with XRE-family HTH domain
LEAVGKNIADMTRRPSDFTRQTVAFWEKNETEPSLETIAAICELLECDLDWLVRGERKAQQ